MTSIHTQTISRITASYMLRENAQVPPGMDKAWYFRRLLDDDDFFDMQLLEFSARNQLPAETLE